MKKTIVAVAVAALAATSANAATVYNQDGTKLDVSGSARVVLTKQTDNRLDLQDDSSRVKFDFSQNLGNGFYGFGYYELRTGDLDGKTTVKEEDGKFTKETEDKGINTKYLYAGLGQDDIGVLAFGKQTTAADSFKLADPTENFTSILDATAVKTEADKVVYFSTAKNDYGLGLKASYIFDNSSAKDDEAGNKAYNKNGYQVLATYENDFDGLGFAAHAMYSHKKGENTMTVPASFKDVEGVKDSEIDIDNTAKTWGLGAKVSYANLDFAADYVHTKFDSNSDEEDQKVKAWQISSTYNLENLPMNVYMAYHQFKYETDKVKGFAIGSHYSLASNVETYVEYTTEKGTWENADRDNKYYAGLRVFF